MRWAETRRIVRERSGLDHDPKNLADPLIPAERLRAHVIAGERQAAGVGAFEDPGGDLFAVVRDLRARGHQPTA